MWGQTMIPANLQSTANQLCLLLGKEKYAHAKQILISADGGRSKYKRVKFWKTSHQKFVNESILALYQR